MDRQTLHDWVIRYNEHGLTGLSDLPKRGGAASKLSVEEKAVLADWVQQGPDLAEDGVVRWRLCDLRERILARFFVVMDERSVWRMLKTLTFSHISCARAIPRQMPKLRRRTKKLCCSRLRRYSRCRARQTDRVMVARRGQSWPARQPDPHLGAARQPTHSPARSALSVSLSVRRPLSGPRGWRWARFTACQCSCDEPASARNPHAGESGGVRCADPRWRRLAPSGRSPCGAGQHRSAPFATLLTRTEPG